MLSQLSVKNLGIIEDIDWNLEAGLNVITGETGAGKSLIIDAVELLLSGSSANKDIVRFGAEKAAVEGIFQLGNEERSRALRQVLAEQSLASDDEQLVISCEIRTAKSAVLRINGRAVTRAALRQIGELLIDIHGQSQHLSLLERRNHLALLDSFAHLDSSRTEYSGCYQQLKTIEASLRSLEQKRADALRQRDFLTFQIREIEAAKLKPGEDAELEDERRRLTQSEKLREYAGRAHAMLAEGDSSLDHSSALAKLAEARKALKKLGELDGSLEQSANSLEQALYTLEEVARELRDYQERLDSDPNRLEAIESRLETLAGLKRKYGQTLPAVQAFLEAAQRDLAALDSAQEDEQQLAARARSLRDKMAGLAQALSAARAQGSEELRQAVQLELEELGMGQMQFRVALSQQEAAEGLAGGSGRLLGFDEDGCDEVEFQVSTNPGEPLKPLASIASTGEISRFTLALKAALAEADRVPVLIFDEIDIGVGGRSGEVLGKKLWGLSRRHQVICVTHLAQIAAFADAHYCVRKTLAAERTVSLVQRLDGRAHVQEMAAMLSGTDFSAAALKNAQELAQKAAHWKNPPQEQGGPPRLF